MSPVWPSRDSHQFFREPSKNALVREHPRLPCVKGAVMAVSRKAMTEGLSERDSSDPLSPSVRTGAAPLGQQGEP